MNKLGRKASRVHVILGIRGLGMRGKLEHYQK